MGGLLEAKTRLPSAAQKPTDDVINISARAAESASIAGAESDSGNAFSADTAASARLESYLADRVNHQNNSLDSKLYPPRPFNPHLKIPLKRLSDKVILMLEPKNLKGVTH